MTSNGTVTLGDITDTITMLDIACDRCERRGRLRVAGLIAPAHNRVPSCAKAPSHPVQSFWARPFDDCDPSRR
jgi:hypothetical protein